MSTNNHIIEILATLSIPLAFGLGFFLGKNKAKHIRETTGVKHANVAIVNGQAVIKKTKGFRSNNNNEKPATETKRYNLN